MNDQDDDPRPAIIYPDEMHVQVQRGVKVTTAAVPVRTMFLLSGIRFRSYECNYKLFVISLIYDLPNAKSAAFPFLTDAEYKKQRKSILQLLSDDQSSKWELMADKGERNSDWLEIEWRQETTTR